MVRRAGWHMKEIEFLAENYAIMTIKELQKGLEDLLPGRRRSADSINAKIKRMKAEGKIEGQKEQDAVNRSLVQRRKDI
jgi:hypothetical protein